MKTLISNATSPILDVKAPGVTPDFYFEIESPGQGKFFRLPVQVKDLTAEGVILEVVDLPHDLEVESLLDQLGIIHLAPDGFSRETQLRTTVDWVRQGERGSSHYLLGLDLQEADFRFRRSLENLLTRPKDISHLWTYWDQVQPPPATGEGRFIFYLCAAALLGGVALQFALPDSYQSLANILILFGSLVIAGKCLWHWRRQCSLSGGG
ncbi:MAG: hypothetical protein A2139_06045 [Desulfobacca sp. RBG_16_60_12]|nr:MAG: hypothetical protein A2139_06045 [Desulfobacca sp. RBG_16_60_12]